MYLCLYILNAIGIYSESCQPQSPFLINASYIASNQVHVIYHSNGVRFSSWLNRNVSLEDLSYYRPRCSRTLWSFLPDSEYLNARCLPYPSYAHWWTELNKRTSSAFKLNQLERELPGRKEPVPALHLHWRKMKANICFDFV